MTLEEITSFQIPSNTGELKKVRKETRNIALEKGFDEKSVSNLVLSVDELSTNAIKYGNNKEETKKVDLVYYSGVYDDRDFLCITIKDKGQNNFDIHKVPEPNITKPRCKEKGRNGFGIFLAKKCMDYIDGRQLEDGYMVIAAKFVKTYIQLQNEIQTKKQLDGIMKGLYDKTN